MHRGSCGGYDRGLWFRKAMDEQRLRLGGEHSAGCAVCRTGNAATRPYPRSSGSHALPEPAAVPEPVPKLSDTCVNLRKRSCEFQMRNSSANSHLFPRLLSPHPDPLPEERGNHGQSVGESQVVSFINNLTLLLAGRISRRLVSVTSRI